MRGLTFSTCTHTKNDFGATVLFEPPKSSGSTSCLWMPQVWHRFPHHLVLLVTDGDANYPAVTEAQRARTIALLLPPHTSEVPVARKSILVPNPKELPYVLGMLLPRARVA